MNQILQKSITEYFKKILIIFWGLWWFIALWTDIVGGLAHLHILNATWAPDLNYPFLQKTLSMYHLQWLAPLFFIAIILSLLICTVLFIWAIGGLNKEKVIWIKRANYAFIFSMSVWLAFFLSDQMLMQFDLEENHMVQGGFELLTYFAIHYLP